MKVESNKYKKVECQIFILFNNMFYIFHGDSCKKGRSKKETGRKNDDETFYRERSVNKSPQSIINNKNVKAILKVQGIRLSIPLSHLDVNITSLQ